jgi:hypothetical protein
MKMMAKLNQVDVRIQQFACTSYRLVVLEIELLSEVPVLSCPKGGGRISGSNSQCSLAHRQFDPSAFARQSQPLANDPSAPKIVYGQLF